ncbi:MAG TPA: phosphotransferase, partial [Acidimicrobiales bacterium]|nr:phosphotransferase [Acidimicrobiales bacterium]
AGEADPKRAWREYVSQCLTEGANGYCLHETLRSYSAESRAVLGWIESIGAAVGDLPSEDLVHLDFHHRNVLRVGNRLSAVVDWESCRPGDRAFDLVTFAFGFTHARSSPETQELVWGKVKEVADHDRFTIYVAYMVLRRLDWTIRHHDQSDVNHLIDFIARVRETHLG